MVGAVSVLLLLTGVWWVNAPYETTPIEQNRYSPQLAEEQNDMGTERKDSGPDDSPETGNENARGVQPAPAPDERAATLRAKVDGISAGTETEVVALPAGDAATQAILTTSSVERTESPRVETAPIQPGIAPAITAPRITTAADEKIFRELELISISPANAVKTKQKANVDLPGAEEGDTGEAEPAVSEEDASVKQVATPRLSLLLSFAPDFSSTSNRYSAPGKAFGAVLHYHMTPTWSLSAGIIRNNKRYTGDGEDYTPPQGYWKYYTNGVVPYSIDGSCSVLEFPLMLQYTIATGSKHRWLAAAGTSSYLMLNESYRYNFEEPNPGAKEGWDSRRESKFYFNMLNITLGYERQVLPGLLIGIEPYVKVPLEEIGWSNIKLFSTGASFTVRYRILGRKNISMPIRSRGPD